MTCDRPSLYSAENFQHVKLICNFSFLPITELSLENEYISQFSSKPHQRDRVYHIDQVETFSFVQVILSEFQQTTERCNVRETNLFLVVYLFDIVLVE